MTIKQDNITKDWNIHKDGKPIVPLKDMGTHSERLGFIFTKTAYNLLSKIPGWSEFSKTETHKVLPRERY